ncbi:hypothetical protein ACLOJK_020706 [Asimina triloba]
MRVISHFTPIPPPLLSFSYHFRVGDRRERSSSSFPSLQRSRRGTFPANRWTILRSMKASLWKKLMGSVHHRSTKIRCSIFSTSHPWNPPPASSQSADLGRPKRRQRRTLIISITFDRHWPSSNRPCSGQQGQKSPSACVNISSSLPCIFHLRSTLSGHSDRHPNRFGQRPDPAKSTVRPPLFQLSPPPIVMSGGTQQQRPIQSTTSGRSSTPSSAAIVPDLADRQ